MFNKQSSITKFTQSIIQKDISKLSFPISLLLMIILKFFLIRNSEVLGHPKDSLGYILVANQKWQEIDNHPSSSRLFSSLAIS
jgi:hypothetical protein